MSQLVNKYNELPHRVHATQVGVDNHEEIASFYGGQVKGIALPPANRCIDFYDKHSGEERRAECGDWVVRTEYFRIKFTQIEVVPDWKFKTIYEVDR